MTRPTTTGTVDATRVPWPPCTHRWCGYPADVLITAIGLRAVPMCAQHSGAVRSGLRESQDPEVYPVTAQTWTEIRDMLIRDGHMTSRGSTRQARASSCTRCGAEVLRAIDDLGLAVEVDPHTLAPLGEFVALGEDRRTLTLVQRDGKPRLLYRDAGRIAFSPAGTVDVLAEHRCSSRPVGPTAPQLWHTVASATFDGPPPY